MEVDIIFNISPIKMNKKIDKKKKRNKKRKRHNTILVCHGDVTFRT